MTKSPLLAALFALASSLPAWAADPPAPSAEAARECASYGLTPDTEEYKACVSAMADQGNDAEGARMREEMNRRMDRMRADIARRNAEMRKQIEQDMNAAQHPANGEPSKCVTTRNGTNTSTVCP